jgi:hypothetical protein
VNADSTRRGAVIKVNGNRFRDLLLQIAEVLALRGDAARSIRIVPPCHKTARLLVTLDLKCDFFHSLQPIIPYRRCVVWESRRSSAACNFSGASGLGCFRERMRLQLGAEMYNILNRPNLGAPSTSITSSTYGQIISKGGNRSVTMALRLEF